MKDRQRVIEAIESSVTREELDSAIQFMVDKGLGNDLLIIKILRNKVFTID